jgi:protein-tyrosine phosphatase
MTASPAPTASLPDVSHVVSPHDHPDRRLGFVGAFNFRDLGGYGTEDGRTVRWRTLYRADALHRLPDDELDQLGQLGVRTVLDLRTAKELEHGKLQAEHLGITHLHLSVLSEIWSAEGLDLEADPSVVLGELYVQMLEVGAPAFAGALRVLADAAQVPAVFHCAAGKDRTGILAALLLATLGVPDDYIAADYAKTEEGMQRMLESWRQAAEDKPVDTTKVSMPPSFYFASPPAVMRAFLAHLADEHGSVVGFVRTLGITDHEIDALRAKLVEPAG